MSGEVKTIEEFERLWYSPVAMQFLSEEDLASPFVQKADAPVLTTTTGVWQAIYGRYAWAQLNMEANVFGVLPKVPFGRSGWRVITARAGTLPYGGTAEAGTLAETIKPTFATASAKPKTVHSTFEVSELQEFMATEGQDDAYASMAEMRAYMATEFKENLNVQLMTQNGTLAGNNLESVDRVVGSHSERINCRENNQVSPYSDDDLDIYGLDRDTADSWADAYVGHNSSVNRDLTDTLILTLIRNVLTNGGNPTFFLTGYDTNATITELYNPVVRYSVLGQATIQPSVNGIQTMEGIATGINVATLHGYPLIISKNTVQDAGGISRLYLLDISNPEGYDLPRLSVKVAKPVQYFEAGMEQATPFAVGKISNKGMLRIMGEIICTFFGAQGKLRDIK